MKQIYVKIIVIVGLLLIIIGTIIYMFYGASKERKLSEYAYVPKYSKTIELDISKKEQYKQQLIDKSFEYFHNNNIEAKNDLKLDVKDIYSSKKCQGSLVFKNQNKEEMFEEVFDINCQEDIENSKVEYKSYFFNSQKESPVELKKISDGYLVFSDSNIVTTKGKEGYKADLKIAKYDYNFKKIWSYDYKMDDIIGEGEVEEEVTDFFTRVENFVEKDDKLFFVISTTEDWVTGNSSLLILNKDGSLYKNRVFESAFPDYIITIKDKVVSFSSNNYVYNYDYENDTLNEFELNTKLEGIHNMLYMNDTNYIKMSEKDSTEDDEVSEGTNSLYLLDKDLNTIKVLDLDKTIGLYGKENEIGYDNKKIIDDKIFIQYSVSMPEEDYSTISYEGLLIINNQLEVVSDIKYCNQKDLSILDFYMYNNELYIMSDLYLEEDPYIDCITIDKYTKDGKELLSSTKVKSNTSRNFDEVYYAYDPEVINQNNNELIYYVIISKETEDKQEQDHRTVLKLVKIKL